MLPSYTETLKQILLQPSQRKIICIIQQIKNITFFCLYLYQYEIRYIHSYILSKIQFWISAQWMNDLFPHIFPFFQSYKVNMQFTVSSKTLNVMYSIQRWHTYAFSIPSSMEKLYTEYSLRGRYMPTPRTRHILFYVQWSSSSFYHCWL